MEGAYAITNLPKKKENDAENVKNTIELAIV